MLANFKCYVFMKNRETHWLPLSRTPPVVVQVNMVGKTDRRKVRYFQCKQRELMLVECIPTPEYMSRETGGALYISLEGCCIVR